VEHLKSNIDALTIALSEADMQEIETAVPFSLGYPYTVLSEAAGIHVSPFHPGAAIQRCANFEGIEEPLVRTPTRNDF